MGNGGNLLQRAACGSVFCCVCVCVRACVLVCSSFGFSSVGWLVIQRSVGQWRRVLLVLYMLLLVVVHGDVVPSQEPCN